MHSPPPKQAEAVFNSERIDFRAIYYLLREKAWLIALCFLVATFGTGTHLMRSPKIYAAKVVLQVEQEEAKVINIQRIQQEDMQTLESLKTVEQVLQNRALLERVIEVNHLASDPRLVSASVERQPSMEQLVSKMAKMVEVRLRKGTRLIDIKVEHTDPGLTELIANSIVKEFLRQSYEHNATASQVANEFLSSEAEPLKRKLEAAENALQAYKEQTQSASVEDRQSIVTEKLRDLSVKVTEAKSQRILQETAYKQVQALGNDVDALLVIPAVANDGAVMESRSNIAKLESDLASLKQRYREKHPKYIQARSQLAEWKNALQKSILNVPQRVRSAYESAKTAEQALEQALQEQEAVVLKLNKQSIRYNVLARDVESDRALYLSVLNRIKETSVTKDLKPDRIRIIQRAEVPEKPVKPEKVRVILAGLMAGLVGSGLLVFLLNTLDRSLKTVDQAEEYLGLPVLSAIPKFAGSKGNHGSLIDPEEPGSSDAESFRTLRTALSMLGRKEDRKVFLFTSALPAEGKTFCSLNYALSLAQQGLRTLVIDCDLRRPMVEKSLLNTNKRSFGLTDYLTGQQPFNAVIHAAAKENFFYLPAGSDAPNPAELLAKTGIDGLIDEALRQFDRVVVDSAPIHAVSDTLLILNRIQTVCLVVCARKTPKTSVRRVAQILREAEAPLAGIVLNLLPRSQNGGYYYYYESYQEYASRGKNAEKKARAA
jgi:capsular exopolysaccharide synthesis family protein